MMTEIQPPPAGCKLGCNLRSTLVGDSPILKPAMMGTLVRSSWTDRLSTRKPLRRHVPLIHYQDGEGSCASNAAITAGLYVPRSVAGLPFVHLAPSSLYKQVNRGEDYGSAVDDNLRALQATGCVPVSAWGGELGWNKPFPGGFEEEAANYQIDEAWDIASFDEFMSALFYGFAISYGVWWYDERGRRSGGHAICALDPIYENGKWGCVFANSWGVNWGDQGFGKMFERQITEGIEYFGGFAPRVATFSEAA